MRLAHSVFVRVRRRTSTAYYRKMAVRKQERMRPIAPRNATPAEKLAVRSDAVTAVGLHRAAAVILDRGVVFVPTRGEPYTPDSSVVLEFGALGDTDEDAADFVRRFGPLWTAEGRSSHYVDDSEAQSDSDRRRDSWAAERAIEIRQLAGEARRLMWIYECIGRSAGRDPRALRQLREWRAGASEDELALLVPFGYRIADYGPWKSPVERWAVLQLIIRAERLASGGRHELRADPRERGSFTELVVATTLKEYIGATLFHWIASGKRIRPCTGRYCGAYLVQDDQRRIWHSDTCRERHRNIARKLGKRLTELIEARDVPLASRRARRTRTSAFRRSGRFAARL